MELGAATPVPREVADRYVAEGLWDDQGLRDGLEAWARLTPDRVAVVDGGTSATYAELAEQVARAVGVLRGRGAGPGEAVLVVASLSVPAVIAYQAVIRTGAIVITLDRRSGRTDVAHAIERTEPRLVVCPADLIEPLGLADTGVPLLTYDELQSGDTGEHDWVEPSPRAAAAVVFTSGTTSRPKGVVHSLNTLRSGARSMADAFVVTSDDVAFLSTPLASITGLVQVHLMLDRGGGLVLEDRFQPDRSLGRLVAHGATLLGGAPVIVEELFRQAAAIGCSELPLRAIALGGTMIPRPVLELATDRYGIVPVRMYGASEIPCATGSLPSDVGVERLADDGSPARGCEIRTDGEISGELLVRGPMRFLGYLDDDDNRSAFLDGGWFRTGDLGLVDRDRLVVTGRLKEVIARKGLKISLAEVDEAASRLDRVVEAATYGVADGETGERLVLALRLSKEASIGFRDITEGLLGAGLAKWKLPEEIVVWSEPLPRTESGKIQRRLVAEDRRAWPRLLAPRLRPETTTE